MSTPSGYSYNNLPADLKFTMQQAPTTGDAVYYGHAANGNTIYVGPDNQPYEWSGGGSMSQTHLNNKVSWQSLEPTAVVNSTVTESTYSGANADTATQNDAAYATLPANETLAVTAASVSNLTPGLYTGGGNGTFTAGANSAPGFNLLTPGGTVGTSTLTAPGTGQTDTTTGLGGYVLTDPTSTSLSTSTPSVLSAVLGASGTSAAVSSLLGSSGVAGLLTGSDNASGGYTSTGGGEYGLPVSAADITSLQPVSTQTQVPTTSGASPVIAGGLAMLVGGCMYLWYKRHAKAAS